MSSLLDMSAIALTSFAKGGALIHSTHIMRALTLELARIAANPILELNEDKFLRWASNLGSVVGLHAYRLLIELTYRSLLIEVTNTDDYRDNDLQLGTYRCVSNVRKAIMASKRPQTVDTRVSVK